MNKAWASVSLVQGLCDCGRAQRAAPHWRAHPYDRPGHLEGGLLDCCPAAQAVAPPPLRGGPKAPLGLLGSALPARQAEDKEVAEAVENALHVGYRCAAPCVQRWQGWMLVLLEELRVAPQLYLLLTVLLRSAGTSTQQ